MIQDLFIIGATGNVGKTLVKQIFELGDADFSMHENPTRIVGLVSSKNFVYDPKGISKEDSYSFINRMSSDAKSYEDLIGLIDLVVSDRDNKKSTLAFVDVTALNEIMTKFHLKVINDTPYGVVTANKNPISLSKFEDFVVLTSKPRRYGYRCSVMAGAEAVTMLRDLKDVNDCPKKVSGCFSGTLGYITSELDKGESFSSIVKKAKDYGFTEPDPRDDLNGLDVARKLIVLARTSGIKVELKDIELEPFIPKSFFKDESVDSFLESLITLDASFEKKVLEAKRSDKVLRYVASLEFIKNKPSLLVSLEEVQKNSPLGNLQGTANKIVVISEAYPKNTPYSVEAPGAGLEVTAQNIRRDLLYLLKNREQKF